METLDGYTKEERLPVLVSEFCGTKLLGVPALTKQPNQRIGEVISNATVSLIEKWKCQQNVKAMAFDTTASNTGHKTAACVSVQNLLKRPPLWLALIKVCRVSFYLFQESILYIIKTI